jgi:hypothetical protein
MNTTKHIAANAYHVYMQKSRGQLSPDDALWITDQYLTQNPHSTIEEAIQEVTRQLIEQD